MRLSFTFTILINSQCVSLATAVQHRVVIMQGKAYISSTTAADDNNTRGDCEVILFAKVTTAMLDVYCVAAVWHRKTMYIR